MNKNIKYVWGSIFCLLFLISVTYVPYHIVYPKYDEFLGYGFLYGDNTVAFNNKHIQNSSNDPNEILKETRTKIYPTIDYKRIGIEVGAAMAFCSMGYMLTNLIKK